MIIPFVVINSSNKMQFAASVQFSVQSFMNFFGPLEFIHKTWGEIKSQDENYGERGEEKKKEGIKLFVSPKFILTGVSPRVL
jgi:hypothetical protein